MSDTAKLEELKAKHGTVYTLTVPTSEDETQTATIYLKKLDRATYSAVSKLISKDELQATEVLLKNLYIGGDDLKLITDNFDALRSASISIVPIIEAKGATLKKN